MELKEWLKEKDITVKEFADIIGCDFSSIYKWMRTNRLPNMRFYLRIQTITKGKVTFNVEGET